MTKKLNGFVNFDDLDPTVVTDKPKINDGNIGIAGGTEIIPQDECRRQSSWT